MSRNKTFEEKEAEFERKRIARAAKAREQMTPSQQRDRRVSSATRVKAAKQTLQKMAPVSDNEERRRYFKHVKPGKVYPDTLVLANGTAMKKPVKPALPEPEFIPWEPPPERKPNPGDIIIYLYDPGRRNGATRPRNHFIGNFNEFYIDPATYKRLGYVARKQNKRPLTMLKWILDNVKLRGKIQCIRTPGYDNSVEILKQYLAAYK